MRPVSPGASRTSKGVDPVAAAGDPFVAAVQQLSTLRDFIRLAVTRFEKAGVFFGHGNASA